MKTSLLVLLFTFFTLSSIMAQDYSGLGNIELKTKEDCRANDNKALECANYLLNTPNDNDNIQRSYTALFILKWMEATPDFGFSFDKAIIDLIDKKTMLESVYSAAMVKYALENREKAKDQKNISLGSAEMFLNYCKNPDNKVKLTKKIKKAIEALDNGTLAEFIK